jgi:5'-deoxynucleotidase YfbR-like HD superfamily hydrolase
MSTERKGDWVQTASGRKFYPLDPRADEVHIYDVAHALSNICRFGGMCRSFYSVAQHCVLASFYAPLASALPVLCHDMAEAYLTDIPRPWKRLLYVRLGNSLQTLKALEANLLNTILIALRCPPATDPIWQPVAEVDMRMLATEARDLMTPLVDNWSNTFCSDRYSDCNPFPEPIEPWTPERAKQAFLKRYAELTSDPLPLAGSEAR